jgi:signal transduction histidine kinase
MKLYKKPLTLKIILFQIFISLIFMIFLTIFEYNNSIKRGYEEIEESFKLFENSYLKPITLSVYYVDESLLDIQLLGALKIKHIDFIKVIDESGSLEIVKDIGIKTDAEYKVVDLPLKHRDVSGTLYRFGHIEVYANISNMKQEVIKDRYKNLFTTLALLVIISISLFLVINNLFIKHFTTIVKYTKELNYTDTGQDLVISRNKVIFNGEDEISLLVNNINSMKNRISMDFKKIKGIEEELSDLNRQLEHKVAEKSSKLDEAIDSLKLTQKKLVESEKLSSLRGLVSSITHEINNPLGISITAISFVKDITDDIISKIDSNTLKKTDLEGFIKQNSELSLSILNNLKRASDLVINLKNIARDQSTEEERLFNLGNYLDDILVSLRLKLKRTKHKIDIECPKDINIYSIPGAYGQIFTNLVLNSLIHGFENIEEGLIEINISINNQELNIIYKDNGNGVSRELKDKIFDPFFTTKKNEGGSGLGLQIINSIVSETLGGSLIFDSKPGEGVLFHFKIPIINKG